MLNPLRKLVLVALIIGAGIALFASVASTLPALDSLAIKNATPPTVVEEVRPTSSLPMTALTRG